MKIGDLCITTLMSIADLHPTQQIALIIRNEGTTSRHCPPQKVYKVLIINGSDRLRNNTYFVTEDEIRELK